MKLYIIRIAIESDIHLLGCRIDIREIWGATEEGAISHAAKRYINQEMDYHILSIFPKKG